MYLTHLAVGVDQLSHGLGSGRCSWGDLLGVGLA